MVFERFIEASFKKRFWLLIRGVTGLIIAFYLTCATLLMLLLELGNLAWDTLLEDS